jgi:hypothetical protein
MEINSKESGPCGYIGEILKKNFKAVHDDIPAGQPGQSESAFFMDK